MIEVVTGGFAGEGEIGRVVAVSDLTLVGLGDGGLAAVAVVGDGDVGGGIAVVSEGQQALSVAVSGDDSILGTISHFVWDLVY